MRILLDENLSADFGHLLVGHEVKHVDDLGLKGLANGKLVAFARENFDVLLTLDRGVLFQHDHRGSPLIIGVVRVPRNTIPELNLRLPAVLEFLRTATPGQAAEI